jgi:diacylglycerol O-acyltransferase / wax synthase
VATNARSGDDTGRALDPEYERLPRAAELFLTRGAAGDLRHAVIVVRLASADPAAPGPLTAERLAAQVASRLHLVPPRFRRVVRHTPLGLAGPILVDDDRFDLSHHVHALSTGAPITEAEEARLIDEYAGKPLDHARPLWEIAVIPRLADGGGAILLKMHHALVEGEGGVANAALLVFDVSPAAEPGVPEPWRPSPAPSRGNEVRLAVSDQAKRFQETIRRSHSVRDMAAAARRQWEALATYRREIAGRRPDPRFRRPAGPGHAAAFAVRPTKQVEAIRVAAGSGLTFNDVLVASVAGGLRRWMDEVGIAETDVMVAVPVNLSRREREVSPVLTEMPSFMLVGLPVTEPDAGARLESVRLANAHGKDVAPALAVVASAIAQFPAPLYRRFADRLYDGAPDFHLSNIQGPDMDLYVLGHRVQYAYLTGRIRSALRVAGLSFAGALTVGIVCDPERAPAPEVLARCIEDELDAMAIG